MIYRHFIVFFIVTILLLSRYYEGGEEEGEVTKERALELVEAGAIIDSTLVYSDDAAFHFEGWAHWSDCSYLFGVGEAPSGGCTSLWVVRHDGHFPLSQSFPHSKMISRLSVCLSVCLSY